MPRTTLICTVGTSLFEGNLSRLNAETPNAPANWATIKTAFDSENWQRLADAMLLVKPIERICGAEINTIEESIEKNWLSLENLFFLVSDTENGRNTGIFLKKYFEQREDLHDLQNIEYTVIENLQDHNPTEFKVHGLRNLVRAAGNYIQRVGGPEYVAIDATGGYKAQIAIAVIVGQALNIPVFYKHERFPEVIDFPPLPISFDYEILARNAALLTDFERGNAFSDKELGVIDDRLRVLLSEVSVNGQSVYELNAIGQIYLTGFRLRNPRMPNLIPVTNKTPPTFGNDHHYPIGFQTFVETVCEQHSWVISANTLPYGGQRGIKGIGFYVQDMGNDNKRLVGTFEDRNNFGARFQLRLTDESSIALTWAADFLNREYRN